MPDHPPLLPDYWSASYVSYWLPMIPADQITSGSVWFDYPSKRFRIDGLFNPWDEAETGHRLWMSEIGDYGRGETHKLHAAYRRTDSSYHPAPPHWETEPSNASLVPQDILRHTSAKRVGTQTILNREVELWSFERPGGKGPATYAIEPRSARLVRMITGDTAVRASVRDFFNFSTDPILAAIFEQPLLDHTRR